MDTTVQTQENSSTLLSGTKMASMFTNAHDNLFKNNTFIVKTTKVYSGRALERLYDNVAPNAILNAGGRADTVKCQPGTRMEVIGLIDKWRRDILNNITPNQMFWLSGPAGAGKTAIVQTVAETWKALDIHTANFFFFRSDTSRSHTKSFVSTLLYQIFDFVPALRDAVDAVLSLKPRILDLGLEEQVDELISAPFRSIQSPLPQPIVLLIDGLDECDSEAKSSQKQILDVLDKLLRLEDLPFLVLVASRAEPHITAAFRQLISQTQSIFLDDQYSPGPDIRLFVTAEFEKIKASHPHAVLLERNWPSVSDIENIVQKSSGQFIYPATVMRFIVQSSAVPSLSLERVQGIAPCAKNSPFDHLDAFYAYILQQADDAAAICDILSSALLDHKTIRVIEKPIFNPSGNLPFPSRYRPNDVARYPRNTLPPINEFIRLFNSRYTTAMFMSCISDISSIVQHDNGRLTFYHASFSDFLCDRSRSGQFHVDLDEFIAKVLPEVWNYLVPKEPGAPSAPLALHLLLVISQTTPAITNLLLTTYPLDSDQIDWYFENTEFARCISRLYYPHDIGSYKQILRRWIPWACRSNEILQALEQHFYKPGNIGWTYWVGNWKDTTDGEFPLLGKYVFVAKMQSQYGIAIARLLAWDF